MDLEGFEQIYRIAIDFLVNYSFQVAGALVILLAGVVVSRWVGRLAVGWASVENSTSPCAHSWATSLA